MSLLLVENACKQFRHNQSLVNALNGASLAVDRGSFLAIMGASGSGKSTLLHAIAGLTRLDSGRVMIDGTDLSSLTDRQLTLFRRRHIGLVFQAYNLIPTLSVEQNLALPLLLEGQNERSVQTKVDQLLQLLGLSDRRDHRPDALSGGEQQRLAIGRALIGDPAVILADEPTGNLDSLSSRNICLLLQSLCRDMGRTIVVVTHEPSVAAYAQEVAVLKDGRIVGRFAVGQMDAERLALEYQKMLKEQKQNYAS